MKEGTNEGGVSMKVFTDYFSNFGYAWMSLYLVMSLIFMFADLLYSIWLTAWVDAIPFMNNTNFIENGGDVADTESKVFRLTKIRTVWHQKLRSILQNLSL